MYKIITAALLASAFALPAAAQSNSSSSSSGSSSGASQQGTMAMQKKIKSDMEQAGFTQVQVMAQSFMVRAHDKQNRPVLMVINPDSVTAVTQVSKPGSSGNTQTSSNDTTKKQ